MSFPVVFLLGQDGITSGAIYALLALSIVLVFSITRILLVPLGEFVTLSALSMAAMQGGRSLQLSWLVLAMALARCAVALPTAIRLRRAPPLLVLLAVPYAIALTLLIRTVPLDKLPMGTQAALTIALVVPLGPLLYDLCFRPLASASTLVLFVVAIAVHEVLVGLSLLIFGPEGARTDPFSDTDLEFGAVSLNAQTLWVIALSLLLIVLLYAYFERTLSGKALRATAVNRFGARLVGISPILAGRLSFTLGALIGAVSGILIAPVSTLYFDSGFILGLKGFVGAIIGGLASYPIAAAGALLVGLVESFSTFWASDYKEVIVFTLLLPVLLWRSLRTRHEEDRA